MPSPSKERTGAIFAIDEYSFTAGYEGDFFHSAKLIDLADKSATECVFDVALKVEKLPQTAGEGWPKSGQVVKPDGNSEQLLVTGLKTASSQNDDMLGSR
jgi:hypothetical protein